MSQSKWAVMVYQAGDNNLSTEMVWALQEMKDAETTGSGVAVVAQLDPRGTEPRRYDFEQPIAGSLKKAKDSEKKGEDTGSNRSRPLSNFERKLQLSDIKGGIEQLLKRLEVRDAEKKAEAIAADVLENSAAPVVIQEFVNSSLEKHEADYQLLVLSGHGHGAVGDFLPDVDPGGALNIRQLGRLLKPIDKKIDILGMDSCTMSMAEVCFELSESGKVDLLVGSEGDTLNTGWPYRRILEAVVRGKGRDPKELARTIVEEYTAYYADYTVAGVSVDLAAVDLVVFRERLLPLFEKLVTELQAALHDTPEAERLRDAVVIAHWEAQSYKDEDYVDVYDFCDRLEKRVLGGSVAGVCREIQDAIDKDGVVLKSCYSGALVQHSHGLSVYFPWSDSSALSDYQKTGFSDRTRWGQFLKDFVAKTERWVRPAKGRGSNEEIPMPVIEEPVLQIRRDPPDTKGGSTRPRTMKNFPKRFRRDECAEGR